ncbi:MAG TPA: TIGR01459 family HAD-type hydrolase [Alphaproteobacteria bacterium]|nr:TIGR01459 family HAD-type hydrolase [Alphaproteobacteria bacterium]
MFKSLKDIIDLYDFFIIDVWGVLHNGEQAFESSLKALAFLKENHKKVLLLSNAPRRIHLSRQRLESLGVRESFYDDIYTSGEDTYQFLKTYSAATFFHLGPIRDEPLYEGLKTLTRTSDQSKADLLVLTGTLTWSCKLKDYEPYLKKALEKNCPLLCVNPDKFVPHGTEISLCGGSIAEEYEKRGGNVFWHGKPYPDFYKRALKPYELDLTKVLAIGDSLATDISGGVQAGIDTMLVLSGLYAPQTASILNEPNTLSKTLEELYKIYGVKPKYVCEKLRV